MTNTERARYAANFMKRRTSRIVSAQNGYNDVMQFADGYTHDTLEDVNTDNGEPDTTTRTDDIGDSDWHGTVPGGSNDDSPIYGAISIIQEHIASLGDDNLLNKWASTADALKKTVSSGMAQASPNANGQTRDPLHVADNDAASHSGHQGYIPTSELMKKEAARMQAEAGNLTTITSRVVGMTSLFEK